MNNPTNMQIDAALNWWRISLCDLPEMILRTDAATIADMMTDYPDGLMTAEQINENALLSAVNKANLNPCELQNERQ
jgi:hypothetical protein